MHFCKKGTLSKEEEKYIKFMAYDTLIEFEIKDLPVFKYLCSTDFARLLIPLSSFFRCSL